ncbi:MAG TPA: hypothetical protein VHB50_23840 [Bryobacteraceae bacterium]|nr:hypothetical protein [Bryobacteraceae bacterium]
MKADSSEKIAFACKVLLAITCEKREATADEIHLIWGLAESEFERSLPFEELARTIIRRERMRLADQRGEKAFV